jgi:hypothetical protein
VLAAWLGVVHGAFALTLLEVHGRSGAAALPLYVDALWWGGLVLALFAPALTMNAWAAERAQGTWQLLLTLPVRTFDLVLGKFLAAWGLLLILLAATACMPATLAVISSVAAPHATACYVGLVLLAAFLAALGTWIGLLVEGPVATYVVTFGIIAVLWLASAGGADGALGPLASTIGLGERLSPFLAGRLALGDVVWFIGGALLFLLLARGAIDALRQPGSMRWWRRLGMVGGPTLVALLLTVLGVAAGTRAGAALDLSADRRFSISPALARQLAAESQPIEFVSIWEDGLDGALAPISDAARIMAAAAPRGTWRRIDPQRHRPMLADFTARHGEAGAPALWVLRGGSGSRIPLDRATRLTLQRDVAGTLLTLADPDPPRFLALQGHGELRPDGRNDDGCAGLLSAITGLGLRCQTIDDASPAARPGDIVAVLGPLAPLGQNNLARLDAHLRDGGGVLIMADDRAPSDLGRWLLQRGVVHGASVPVALFEKGDLQAARAPDAALMPARHLVSLANHVAGSDRELPHQNLLLRGPQQLNPQHPLTRRLIEGGLQLLSPFTAACEALPATAMPAELAAGYQPVPLLMSAPADVWERRRGEPLQVAAGLEQAEARTLAWAISYGAADDAATAGRGGRLVVWGSRQAAADASTGQAAFANGQFIASASRWLAHREAPPDVPQAELRAFQIDLSDRALEILVAVLAILLPVCCIGGALLAWLEQRR